MRFEPVNNLSKTPIGAVDVASAGCEVGGEHLNSNGALNQDEEAVKVITPEAAVGTNQVKVHHQKAQSALKPNAERGEHLHPGNIFDVEAV